MTFALSASSRGGGSSITCRGVGTETARSGVDTGTSTRGAAGVSAVAGDAASAAASNQVIMAASSGAWQPEPVYSDAALRKALPPRVARRSVQGLEPEDGRQDHRQHGQFAALVAAAVAVVAVVAVLVTALESLPEIVAVLVVRDVVTVVAVTGVEVAVAAAIVVAPAVLTIVAACAQAFVVAQPHRVAHQVGAVAVGLVPAAAIGVAVAGRGGIERIARIVPRGAAPASLLLVEAGVVVALVAVLGQAPLLLQGAGVLGATLLGLALPLLAIPTELLGALPVGLNPRLVALAVGAVMDGIAGLRGPVRTRGLAAGLRIAGPGGRPLALRAWLVVAPRRRLGCTGPGHAWGLRRARRLDTRGLAVRAGAGGPGPVRAGAHGLLAAASITCGLPAALPR